jgi:hypothetical protein
MRDLPEKFLSSTSSGSQTSMSHLRVVSTGAGFAGLASWTSTSHRDQRRPGCWACRAHHPCGGMYRRSFALIRPPGGTGTGKVASYLARAARTVARHSELVTRPAAKSLSTSRNCSCASSGNASTRAGRTAKSPRCAADELPRLRHRQGRHRALRPPRRALSLSSWPARAFSTPDVPRSHADGVGARQSRLAAIAAYAKSQSARRGV